MLNSRVAWRVCRLSSARVGLGRQVGENVALIPDRMKKVDIETAVNLLPKPVHVHVDDIRERIEGLVPYVLRDRVATKESARVEHEELYQRVLFSCQPDAPAAADRGVIGGIQT